MKKTSSAVIFILLAGIMAGYSGTKTSISVISTTSVKDSLPYVIFDGKTWEADPDSKYVKVDFLLDSPVKIGSLNIEMDNPVTEQTTIFLNVQDAVYDVYPKGNVINLSIPYSGKVQSININFGRNSDISIKSLRLFDREGNVISVKSARAVNGSVSATSTLDPQSSYSIWGIFDSRLEYGWSSNHKMTGDVIEFRFDEPQKITALKFWNGYQRSKIHFDANSRFKTLRIEDDRGFSQTVNFEDKMGAQEIRLSKTLAGCSYLKMTVLESYAGSRYKDLVLSELRFFDGDNYFLINPVNFIRENIKHNRDLFNTAEVGYILDQSIHMPQTDPDYSDNMSFRFRSDGSVYAEGSVSSNKYFLLGNYEILKSIPGEGLNLKLFGYIVTQQGEWKEFTSSGGDCGGGPGGEYVYKNSTKKIFSEFLTVSKAGNDSVSITNTGDYHFLNFDMKTFDLEQ